MNYEYSARSRIEAQFLRFLVWMKLSASDNYAFLRYENNEISTFGAVSAASCGIIEAGVDSHFTSQEL